MLTLFLLFRDFAVQTVVEAVSVKLQQYVYADEEATGKYYHIFILKSYFDIYYLLLDSDYIVLTSSNNEAIVIACLHHSVFRLGSTSSTIAVTECFTDNVINLAMRIQRYIVLQRAGMSVEEKHFFKCQRKVFIPTWTKNEAKSETPKQSNKRSREQGNFIITHCFYKTLLTFMLLVQPSPARNDSSMQDSSRVATPILYTSSANSSCSSKNTCTPISGMY